MSRRLAEERTQAERLISRKVKELISNFYTELKLIIIFKIDGDAGSQWEYASKLQSELDRHKRAESDLRRELSQKNHQIEDIKAEYRHKLKTLESEIRELNAVRERLEAENRELR